MLALERLSPLERAAFLLHDVFGLDSRRLRQRSTATAAACRQLAARARTHVRTAKPRLQVEKQRGLALAEVGFDAVMNLHMYGGLFPTKTNLSLCVPVSSMDCRVSSRWKLMASFRRLPLKLRTTRSQRSTWSETRKSCSICTESERYEVLV